MLEREVALYRGLQAMGIRVRFVTYGDRQDEILGMRLKGIEVIGNRWRLPLSWYRRSLLWQLGREKGQIFKSNQVAGADFALHAAKKRDARFIARCGYLLSDFEARSKGIDSLEAKAARQLERRVFRGADRAVVTTEAMKSVLLEEYRVPVEKVNVIPNYVLTDSFRPSAVGNRKRPRIGFVGRLDAQKNLIMLLQAISALDVELLIVGEGPQKAELVAWASRGVADVRFVGNRPHSELPALLNNCDLFVLPSLHEGHPKALLEAMSCGLPVIGARVPGIQELIVDGVNGLLSEPEAEDLRAAIRRLLGDKSLRRRLGRKARAFVVENFSLQQVLHMEFTLLRELGA